MRIKHLIKSLYFQVLIAIATGILLGHFYPSVATKMKPLGDGFIQLVKMLIAPIIFLTVVSGIAGVKDAKTVGKTGGYALIYFEILSTFGLIIGLVVVNLLKPGVGMNVDLAQLDTQSVKAYINPNTALTLSSFLLDIIPNTFISALTSSNILQVLLVALLFGFGLHASGERGQSVLSLIDKISEVFFYIVNIIMKLAPLGALGAMAFTIGEYGIGTLLSLTKLMGTLYITCLVFIFGVLGLIAYYHGFSIWKFLKYIKEELLIVLSTSSSESVLPRMMAKMENLGVAKPVVGLVIPAGYSFNLDGTSIYLTMAVVFIAQATNVSLSLSQEIILLLILLLASKGAAGVTGSGFIVLAATLSSFGHVPVEGLALILGIDRFMSEARALTNVIGNGVATVVIGKWCKQVNQQQLRETLMAKNH